MDRHAAATNPTLDRAHADVLAVILAGGRGERLGALTAECAKPVVPFGGGYRVIDFTLSNCVNSGIRRVGVLTQYRSDTIAAHVGHAWCGRNASACVSVWDAAAHPGAGSYRGTADAVYRNLDKVERAGPRLVLVLAGDHVYRMDYRRMIADHLDSGAEITVGCIEAPLADAHRYGVLGTDAHGRIRAFAEKPADPEPVPHRADRALVSMGIYLFDAAVLRAELDRDAALERSHHDFGGDVIPHVVRTRHVHAHRFEQSSGVPGFWRDIGTLDSYHEASLAMLDAGIGFDPADPLWPVQGCAVSHHPVRFRQPSSGAVGRVESSNLGAGCLIDGGRVTRSILSENVTVRARAVVSDSVLLPGAVVGEGCRLHRTIVAAGCTVPGWVRMGAGQARDTIPCHTTPGGVRLLTQADVDRWLSRAPVRRAGTPLAAPGAATSVASNG